MGKISDIWVRLGLKKEGFDKGMNDVAKQTQKAGGGMQKMLSAAKLGWAAVGTAVIAFGKEMIAATNKVGDAWTHMVAEGKGRWQSMLADISNYKPDFSSLKNFIKNDFKFLKNMFGNAKEAGDAAREMSQAWDAEFELTNSLKIQRARISGELADLQVAMRNQALTPEARKAATERYKALLEPLYQAEIAVRKNMLDTAVQAWLAGSGVQASTQEVSDFFALYGIDPAKAAAQSPELARIYETRKGDKANQPIFDAIVALTQAENGLTVELKKVNTLANTLTSTFEQAQQELADFELELEDDFEIEPIDWDNILGDYESELDGIVDKWKDTQEEIANLNQMLEDTIIRSMSGGMQAITDMVAGVEGANMAGVAAALLEPMANLLTQFGEMLVASGMAMSAFKKGFKTLDPAIQIAAGVGLIALGAAMSSGIKALANTSGGASTATTSAAGATSSAGGIETYEQEITVHVVGEISGDKIVLSGQKTLNKWSR